LQPGTAASMYVGFNRVIAGNFRAGSGLCRVVVSLFADNGQFIYVSVFCMSFARDLSHALYTGGAAVILCSAVPSSRVSYGATSRHCASDVYPLNIRLRNGIVSRPAPLFQCDSASSARSLYIRRSASVYVARLHRPSIDIFFLLSYVRSYFFDT